ncbi:MAG TPA: hypothetical protein VGJ15_06955 [Pirellulales bacterium]|jgi:predicted anti-sigma-YlaC factor YlaD
MQCAEFKVRLDWVLDHRGQPDDDLKLRAHARNCPDCGDWMSAHTELFSDVTELAPAPPNADFALCVLQTVETERQRFRRLRMRAVAALSLAAALVISVVGWQIVGSSDTVAPSGGGSSQPIALNYRQLAETTRIVTSENLALMGQVAEGLKPVTSVYTALNSLLRTLPGNELANVVL